MNKRIVLISSGQPSANPRLVKEAVSLSEAGYKIKVLYCPLSLWADPFDNILFRSYPKIEWIKVGYHPVNQKWGYRFARARQKSYQLLYKYIGNRFDAAIRSMVLFSQELVREAKKHKADLYLGHNLGALPAVVKAAQSHSALATFDFEDYHRGEDVKDSLHWKKTEQIEGMYV
ncbi:MAG TPA: hypothetical protein VK498_10860, partial [Ferruginibacter sp.]|nr:hypothetical protein [Ferruginibacter sp.]